MQRQILHTKSGGNKQTKDAEWYEFVRVLDNNSGKSFGCDGINAFIDEEKDENIIISGSDISENGNDNDDESSNNI